MTESANTPTSSEQEEAIIEQKYREIQEFYGEDLPNFKHNPIQFAHYVQMFKWIKSLERQGA